jgi:site-specific recombinase XerD
VTIDAFLRQWLGVQSNRIGAQTLYGYQGYVRRYLSRYLGHVLVSRLQPVQIQDMETALLERGLSGTTVGQAHRILHKALTDAVSWGIVFRNAADAVAPPCKSRRKMQVLSPSRLKQLLDAGRGTAEENLYLVAAHTRDASRRAGRTPLV